MKVIINDVPSTFFSDENNVRILDDEKKDFYFHPNKEKAITFNLPAGKFYTDSSIFRKPNFIPYPYAGKIIPIPVSLTDMKILKGYNENKATVNRLKNTILIDTKLFKDVLWYKPAMWLLLSHELSHYVVPDNCKDCEEQCDINGRNILLQIGFNPSQIEIAANMLLDSGFRIDNLSHFEGSGFRR